jgi:hypothetical protein
MYPEAALVNGNVGPHPGHQLVLADDHARLLDERHQDIESSSRKVKRTPVFLNATLRGLQMKRAKRNDSRYARVRVKPTSNTLYAVDHCWHAISGKLP